MLEMLLGGAPVVEALPGQKLFQVATTSWIVPDGVKSICAVCIGAGSRAALVSSTAYGGMGGALRYLNAIPVTPGETLTIQVGQSTTNIGYTTGSVGFVNGGDTTILRGSTVLLRAAGGRQTQEAQAAACINGQGGLGGIIITGTNTSGLPGSGTGGYVGDGGGSTANNTPTDTSAGKSGGVSSNTVNGQTITSGANGNGARAYGIGVVVGSLFGGGGGSARRSSDNAKAYSNSGAGACRIIWGTDRSYPNAAADV